MTGRRENTLGALVEVLVDQWGAAKVRAAVDAASERPRTIAKSRNNGEQQSQSAKAKKPTARELVERLEAPAHRKEILLRVADQFDRRDFMPSVADIRNFLEMRGFHAGSVKDRADAFRAVLRVLVVMADDRLEKLARESLRSGPSQLGPLSDAISTSARGTRSRDDLPGDDLLSTHKNEADK